MKKPVNLILLFIIILSFTTSCKDKDEDKCFEYKQPLIEREFSFSVTVQYLNGEPYQGDINIYVYKKYCDVTISGEYNLEGKGDEDGFWRPGYLFVYKFENEYDDVFVQFNVNNIKTGQHEYTLDSWQYLDVRGQLLGIEMNYPMQLPWNAEDE